MTLQIKSTCRFPLSDSIWHFSYPVIARSRHEASGSRLPKGARLWKCSKWNQIHTFQSSFSGFANDIQLVTDLARGAAPLPHRQGHSACAFFASASRVTWKQIFISYHIMVHMQKQCRKLLYLFAIQMQYSNVGQITLNCHFRNSCGLIR
jgi:hypothetical protein